MNLIRSTKAVLLFILLSVMSCQEPYPNRPLSKLQMKTDFMTYFSQDDSHYAFIKYKENTVDYRAKAKGLGNGLYFQGPKIAGVHDGKPRVYKFNELKRVVLRIIDKGNLDNITFSALLQEYNASFRDAHKSLNFLPNKLEGASKMAYVGFFVSRDGENALVREIHPLMKKSAHFPIQPGDIITHVDGIKLRDYINNEMSRFRNLGKEESNMTFLMNTIFNRDSLRTSLPTEGSDMVVTVDGKGEIPLPWVQRDYADFTYNLNQLKDDPTSLTIFDSVTGETFDLAFIKANGRPMNIAHAMGFHEKVDFNNPHKVNLNIFNLAEYSTISSQVDKYKARIKAQGKQILVNEGRYIPANAMFVEEANTFPAYITHRKMQNGRVKTIGYIRIGTFSPEAKEEVVLAELQATLMRFQNIGVKDLVIDTIDNPGGSLSLVSKVAQAFSNEKIKTMDMRFGLNQNWMNDFKQLSQQAGMDSESELARRVYKELEADFAKGLKLSSQAYSVDTFMPYTLSPNVNLQKKFNIMLLQSEGNASCGDIFPYLMKVNELAILAGQDTMGAGGNVVKHLQSVHTHGEMRETESALVDELGRFIENVGVEADLPLNTFRKTSGYPMAIETAIEILKTPKLFNKLDQAVKAKRAVKLCNKNFQA